MNFAINKAYFAISKDVRLVDGFNVRNTQDIDFSGLADHDMNPIVPVGQLWLDEIYREEADLFIQTYFKMKELMKSGKHYEEAKALLRHAPAASASDVISAGLLIGPRKTVGKNEVCLVDGARVRLHFDPNFKYGGHGLVYDYVGQKNLILIDDKVLEKERTFIEEHEDREIEKMETGWDYDDAHDYANAFEKIKRRRAGISDYHKC